MARSRGWDAVRSHELAKAAALMAVEKPSIAEALSAVMEDVREVRKTGHNQLDKGLADLTEADRPALKASLAALSKEQEK